MNKAKGLMVGTFFITVILVFLANQGLSHAAEAKLVKIQPSGGEIVTGFTVDPGTITVNKNAIVVWMSGVPGMEIQIVFNEGKLCRDVTAVTNQNHPSFFMNPKNCYVTNFLPYCATSTLQFPDAGTFEYNVVNEDGKMQAKGKIVVK